MPNRSATEDRDGRASARPTTANLPDVAPADEEAQAPAVGLSELAEAQTLALLQDSTGNALLGAALAGDQMDGFGTAVATEMAGAVEGLQGGGPLSSNTAMARLMRYAGALEMDVAADAIAASSGRSLEPEQRERLEAAFDHDFDHVRIHADAAAERAARALDAYAFALGADVFFGRGGYRPGTAFTDRLLAHELTHVVQHDQGRLPSASDDLEVSSPSDAHEREAYANETRILRRLAEVDAELAAADADPEIEAAGAEVEAESGTAEPVVEPETKPETEVETAEPEVEPESEVAPQVAAPDADAATAGPALGDDGDPDGDPTPTAAPDGAPAMRKRNAGGGRLRAERPAEELAARSTGKPLPEAVAQRMSAALGHPFDGVHVHTDAAAGDAARELGARAFALGADVFFAPGAFQPGTRAGDETLAHELAHVKQHDEGRLDGLFGPGMYISKPSDAAEQDADAQADAAMASLDTFDEVNAALGAAPDPGAVLAALHPAPGPVVDADSERRALTESLLGRLALSLDISPGRLRVRVDERAHERTHALGTRGVMEHGEILLDPEAYDPSTTDGRQLLAHEATHVAQAGVPFHEGATGSLAEAEAHVFADAFVHGGDVSAPGISLPVGHTAREGGGGGLSGQLAAHMAALDGETSALSGKKHPDKPPEVGGAATQDHSAKLSRYKDGVDTYAGKVTDLAAYSDLKDAYSNYDPIKERATLDKKVDSAMARIKSSKAFEQLAGQYKAAVEDKDDGGAMKSAFEDQFNGHWYTSSSSDSAGAKIRAAAIERGNVMAGEDAAKKAKEAKARAQAAAAAKAKAGKGGDVSANAGSGNVSGAPGKGNGANKGSSITSTWPIPDLDDFTKAAGVVEGGEFNEMVEKVGEHRGFMSEYAKDHTSVSSRFSVIGKELLGGALGGFTKGFVGGFKDSLILNTLGNAGDKLVGKIPGLNKVPVIGSVIQVVQAGVFTKGFWTVDKNPYIQGAKETEKDFSKGVGDLEKMWHAKNLKDGVGLFFAALAEFLGGIATFLDTVAQILGILSAVCYILGAILIIVGIALSWLGIGEALFPIADFLIDAGGMLKDASEAIAPFVPMIKAAALVCRVVAALFVPAEAFAEQVDGMHEQSADLSQRVGTSVGDTAGSQLKEHAQHGFPKDEDLPPGSQQKLAEGEGKGKAKADAGAEATNKSLDEAQQNVKKMQAEAAKSKKGGGKGKGDDEGSPGPKKPGGEDDEGSAAGPKKKKGSGGEDDDDTPQTPKKKKKGGSGEDDEQNKGKGKGKNKDDKEQQSKGKKALELGKKGLKFAAKLVYYTTIQPIGRGFKDTWASFAHPVKNLQRKINDIKAIASEGKARRAGMKEHRDEVKRKMKKLKELKKADKELQEKVEAAANKVDHLKKIALKHPVKAVKKLWKQSAAKLKSMVKRAQSTHNKAMRALDRAQTSFKPRAKKQQQPTDPEEIERQKRAKEEREKEIKEEAETREKLAKKGGKLAVLNRDKAIAKKAKKAKKALPGLEAELKEAEKTFPDHEKKVRLAEMEGKRQSGKAKLYKKSGQIADDHALEAATRLARLKNEERAQAGVKEAKRKADKSQKTIAEFENELNRIKAARKAVEKGTATFQDKLAAKEDASWYKKRLQDLHLAHENQQRDLDQRQMALEELEKRNPTVPKGPKSIRAEITRMEKVKASWEEVAKARRATEDEALKELKKQLDIAKSEKAEVKHTKDLRNEVAEAHKTIDEGAHHKDIARAANLDLDREERYDTSKKEEKETGVRKRGFQLLFGGDAESSSTRMGYGGSAFEKLLDKLKEGENLWGSEDVENDWEKEEKEKKDKEKKEKKEALKAHKPKDSGKKKKKEEGGEKKEKKGTVAKIATLYTEAGHRIWDAAGHMVGSDTTVLKGPPHDPGEMMEHFKNAQTGARAYVLNTALANEADAGQKIVTGKQNATLTLKEKGVDPLKNYATKKGPEINKAQSNESQRGAKLAGTKTTIKPASGAMQSKVAGLGSKMNSGYAKGGPSGSQSASSGTESAKAQNKAGSDTDSSKSKGQKASSENEKAMGDIARANQDVQKTEEGHSTALAAKAQEQGGQKADLEAIRDKANADAEAGKGIATSEAKMFDSDFEDMQKWADTFTTAMAAYEAGKKKG